MMYELIIGLLCLILIPVSILLLISAHTPYNSFGRFDEVCEILTGTKFENLNPKDRVVFVDFFRYRDIDGMTMDEYLMYFNTFKAEYEEFLLK